MARPSKFSPTVQKKLCAAIVLGATFELACKAAGIGYETMNRWRKERPEFAEAIEQAEGEATVRWLSVIEQAAREGQWQAAAWKLERRYPNMYGRTVVQQEQSGAVTVRFVNDWRGSGDDGGAAVEASAGGGTLPMIEAASSGDDDGEGAR